MFIHSWSTLRPIQVSAHVRRIEAVEKNLKALAESTAGKEDVTKLRSEMKKLHDGLHVGQFCHIWRYLCTHYYHRVP